MNLSIKELNDLYYCIGYRRMKEGLSVEDDKDLEMLSDRIWKELMDRNREDDDEEKEVYN